MSYELILLEAKIPEPLTGDLKLAIHHQGERAAGLNLSWTKHQFSAQFVGFAAEMPEPAHPACFIKAACDAIHRGKRSPEERIEALFERENPVFSVDE